MARRNPLVLVFEDIHWADHGMLDLIEYLAQWVRGPLILLCLARDELLERRQRWGGGRHEATSILLDPLTVEQTRELVTSLLGGSDGDAGAVAAVAERAGGNPFFAEEMARRLAEEAGGDRLFDLPDTVQGLLAARLDSLEPAERTLVQHAAVMGRTFWEGSLAIAGQSDTSTREALQSLQEKDLIVPEAGVRLAGEREYAFKHVLIRDVAYGMLPRAVRCRKHYEVGQFIEDRAGERTDEVVTLLAEHYDRAATLAGEADMDVSEAQAIKAKAVRFLESAGDVAASLYSNPEAYDHYESVRRLRGEDAEDEA
jgi:predicted ATPase